MKRAEDCAEARPSPEQNKALVLEAFDTLFKKRDYDGAGRHWSNRYIQHSAPYRTRP
jgi:hypothetical protein